MNVRVADYDIIFSGLSDQTHEYHYHLDNSFFELFKYHKFHQSDIQVKVLLHKSTNLMTLDFDITGTVNVDCDVTAEVFDKQIAEKWSLIIKFSEEQMEDDGVLVLPYGAHKLNISQYMYETVVLSLPMKLVGSNADKKLEYKDEQENRQIDPRWDKLKQLLK